eukprot:symbB.v1.2.035591.t1/scaffold4833.1/size34140/4
MSCERVMYCWCQGYRLRHSLFDVAPAVIGAKLRPAAQAPGDLDESTRGRLALQWQVVVPYAMRRIQSLLW